MLDVKELTKKYGSPLFVVDEQKIVDRYTQMKNKFSALYPKTEIAYAYKANYLLEICRLIDKQGGLAEVISGFEYQIAKSLGIEGKKIIVNGPYKPAEELIPMIADSSIINVDNLEELEKIDEIAKKQEKTVDVGIRINAKIGKLPWYKFGFNVGSKEAFNTAKAIKDRFTNINLKGIHIHIGTNITQPDLYRKSVLVVLDLIRKIKDELGIKIDYIDMGGGYPTKHACPANHDLESWNVPDIEEYAEAICRPLNDFYKDDDERPRLILEPGRYLVDEAVSLVTSVTSVKSIFGIRSVFVDAGVNILPSAHYRKHRIDTITRIKEKELTDIYGSLCMNADLLESGIVLPKVEVGDILKFHNTGAYELSHSMQFSRLRPAVVSIKEDGKIVLARRKETVEDIIRLDRSYGR
ncbi:MAG: alanine racemase [archaeon]|nr:alanine racemase [archaeon]